MRKLLELALHFILSGFGVFLVAKLMPGIEVRSFKSAVFFAIVLAILNTLAWGLLAPITYTFAFLTLGVGAVIVNTFLFMMASKVADGVRTSGCITAGLAAIAVSFVNAVIHAIFGT